jgi:uncharacterized protein YggE
MNISNQDQVWRVGKWVGILLIIFLAVISFKELRSISFQSRQFPVMNTISVSGKGEAVSIPDIATFSFSVNENAKTVKEAQDKATARINTTLDAVKKNGVAEKDIKTLSYSINPRYEYNQIVCVTYPCPQGKQTLTGYDVEQTVQVKIRDLTKAGELFDIIGATGIKTVNGLQFSIDDIDSVKAIARADAITKAQAKAESIAKALGVRLFRVTSYYDNSDDVYYPRESAMGGDVMNMKAQMAPQIPTGEQKVTANVTINYEIR